jgi:MoxR-like ATPase
MFLIPVDYPAVDEEFQIARRTTSNWEDPPKKVLSHEQVIQMIDLVRRLRVPQDVAQHAMEIARLSRPGEERSPASIREWVQWGAGPRAGQYLILGAKARAVLAGRATPDKEDVDAIAHPVLRHRILPNFQAEAEGIGTDAIVDRLLDRISPKPPRREGFLSWFGKWFRWSVGIPVK